MTKTKDEIKRDPISLINSIKIEKGIPCPPINMTSPWTYIALKMRVGDSIKLERYDHVLKIKYALLRLGFAFVRRKFGEDDYRVWKMPKSKRGSKNPTIPDRAYYTTREGIIIGSKKKCLKKKK